MGFSDQKRVKGTLNWQGDPGFWIEFPEARMAVIPNGVPMRKAKDQSVGGAQGSKATSTSASPSLASGGHQVSSPSHLARSPVRQ